MRNEEIKAELDALRAEVAALGAAREASAQQEKTLLETDVDTDEETLSDPEHEGFIGHVQELAELLEGELRDTPVVSGLVIFSIGLLVGRFLR